jgi:hypothetical protein
MTNYPWLCENQRWKLPDDKKHKHGEIHIWIRPRTWTQTWERDTDTVHQRWYIVRSAKRCRILGLKFSAYLSWEFYELDMKHLTLKYSSSCGIVLYTTSNLGL